MRKIPVGLSMDDELLDEVDAICEINGLTRSQFICEVIREKLDYINETIAEQKQEKENHNGC